MNDDDEITRLRTEAIRIASEYTERSQSLPPAAQDALEAVLRSDDREAIADALYDLRVAVGLPSADYDAIE